MVGEKNKKGFILGIILAVFLIVGIVVLSVLKFEPKNKLKEDNSIVIKFDSNGGSEVSDIVLEKGETFERPKDPVKDNYLFLYWELNNEIYDFSLDVENSLNLEAVWSEEIPKDKEMYSIRYNTGIGKTISNDVVEKGAFLKERKIDNVGNTLFKGWLVDNNLFNFEQGIFSNIEMNAKWLENGSEDSKLNDRETFLVEFDSAGGTSKYSVKVLAGDSINEPTPPVKEGYKFEGWYLFNNEHDFSTGIYMNVKLVAKWSEIKEDVDTKKFTITFDTAGGTPIEDISVAEGEKVKEVKEPTKEGYVFKGWLFDGSPIDITKVNITRDLNLLAKWQRAFKVDFYSNNRPYSSQIVEINEKAVATPDPILEGYIFKGWTLNGEKYNFDSLVTQDLVLVALWKKAFNVTFESTLRGTISILKVAEGDKVVAPKEPKTFEKYVFNNWFHNGKKYNFNNLVYQNMTIMAGWSYILESPNCDKCGDLGVNVLNTSILTIDKAVLSKDSNGNPKVFSLKISPRGVGQTKFTLHYEDGGYGTYVVNIKEDMVPRLTDCDGKYCFL